MSYYDTESEGDDEGYLVAYEQIDFDWKESGNWERHVIADKFVANPFLFGHTMSPGKHRPFYPSRYGQYYRITIFYKNVALKYYMSFIHVLESSNTFHFVVITKR